MEYLICCACSLACFACGVWAARGLHVLHRRKKPEQAWSEADDALSRDIAALMAYTGPNREEDAHEDS